MKVIINDQCNRLLGLVVHEGRYKHILRYMRPRIGAAVVKVANCNDCCTHLGNLSIAPSRKNCLSVDDCSMITAVSCIGGLDPLEI